MENFRKLGLSEKLLKIVGRMGFENPTEIQEKAIPLALGERDIIGSSATGSGKTLAFSLGVIENIEQGKGLQFLVLTPTRELADQITKVLKGFTKEYGLRVIEIYGGVSISRQIDSLPKTEVVVGTPGRILDHLERRTIDLSRIKVLVLDEADRMSDMGFLPDVEKIVRQCPERKQTMLFSATITSDVNYISGKYMKNPEYVSVESHVDPSKLKQVYYDVSRNMKFSLLVYLLRQEKSRLVMVFCNTRDNSDMLARNLKRYELNAMAIHGGLEQKKRTRLLQSFHEGEINILVCTDVAARGLDIKGISHVYNYDMPKTSTEYIHRVGRTARAGKEGIAVSIVSDRDYDNFRRVLQDESLKIEKKEVPEGIEKLNIRFERDRERSGGFGRGGGRPSGKYGRRDSSQGRRGTQRGSFSRGRQRSRNFRRESFSSGDSGNRGSRDKSRDRSNRGRSSGFSRSKRY